MIFMEEFNRTLFAERLKELRKEKNIGQNALAKALNLSNASVSYWETGKQLPSAEAVYKLARFYGVSADFLLGLKDY